MFWEGIRIFWSRHDSNIRSYIRIGDILSFMIINFLRVFIDSLLKGLLLILIAIERKRKAFHYCIKQLWYIRFTLADTSHTAEKRCRLLCRQIVHFWRGFWHKIWLYFYLRGTIVSILFWNVAHFVNRIPQWKRQLANGINGNSYIFSSTQNVLLMSFKLNT